MSEPKMVIVMRRDLNMRKGKSCAQAGHAALKFLTENNDADRSNELYVKLSKQEAEWLWGASAKIVVSVDSEDELKDIIMRAELKDIQVHSIIDAGRTEFDGVPTMTCCALGPDDGDLIDQVTGNLKLW